jgi:hypothetical protein
MARGLLKFFGVLALFVVAGAYFAVPAYLSAAVGALVGGVFAGTDWYQRRSRTYTRDTLAAKPFNGKLPIEIGLASVTAVALAGDNSYQQRVIGEAGFTENFEDLRQYANAQDNTVLELQVALVAEPANPHSSHAVAVTAGGVVLGYIPEFESESLFGFLMQHRGLARVNANIHLHTAMGASRVELDLVRPFQVVPGV